MSPVFVICIESTRTHTCTILCAFHLMAHQIITEKCKLKRPKKSDDGSANHNQQIENTVALMQEIFHFMLNYSIYHFNEIEFISSYFFLRLVFFLQFLNKSNNTLADNSFIKFKFKMGNRFDVCFYIQFY